MKSTGSKTMQRGGSGVKAEPKKMHARVRCKQACGAHAEQGHACKEGGGEEREGKGRKKGERRLSALGSQDTLVKARQVGPGIDANAILFKHQREA